MSSVLWLMTGRSWRHSSAIIIFSQPGSTATMFMDGLIPTLETGLEPWERYRVSGKKLLISWRYQLKEQLCYRTPCRQYSSLISAKIKTLSRLLQMKLISLLPTSLTRMSEAEWRTFLHQLNTFPGTSSPDILQRRVRLGT